MFYSCAICAVFLCVSHWQFVIVKVKEAIAALENQFSAKALVCRNTFAVLGNDAEIARF